MCVSGYGADSGYCSVEIVDPDYAFLNQLACLYPGSIQAQREVNLKKSNKISVRTFDFHEGGRDVGVLTESSANSLHSWATCSRSASSARLRRCPSGRGRLDGLKVLELQNENQAA